jgi:ArsR family transcriptional regulator
MKTIAANNVDRMFRAFAEPTRLRILHLLVRSELCVCDIVSTLDVPQPTASRHLAYLRNAGLVQARQEGQWHYYQLTQPRNAFHKKLLECLSCCSTEVPQLARDRKQLSSGRCC